MKKLWKGIAIAGIWLSLAIICVILGEFPSPRIIAMVGLITLAIAVFA